jgi:hypothetical protein
MCNEIFSLDFIGISRHKFGCCSEIENSPKKWQSLFMFSLFSICFSAVSQAMLLVLLLLLLLLLLLTGFSLFSVKIRESL